MIVITGQTGTGKTAYALKLAKKVNGELVNCDSRQIYKDLNIVTGKDLSPNCHFEEVKRLRNLDIGYFIINDIPIWLYDIVKPSEPFSSYEYKLCALEAISAIEVKGKVPIIVGGTYLYIRSLLYGFETEKIPPDWRLREILEKLSVQKLQEKLALLNPEEFDAMNNSDQNNPRRLMRKIEIIRHPELARLGEAPRRRVSGSPHRLSVVIPAKAVIQLNRSPIWVGDDIDFIALKFPDNATMREVIGKRVMERFENGAVEETRELFEKGYKETDPGLQTIGYKELIEYRKENTSKDEMIQKWILAETKYAKRQHTFMKKDLKISWLTI